MRISDWSSDVCSSDLPQERCRCGDALGMVAGGIGDHAAGAIPLRNPADAVVGAAELEGTGALQRFRLQQYAPADALVEGGRFEKGGADGQSRQCPGGFTDVIEGRRGGRSEEHKSELQTL